MYLAVGGALASLRGEMYLDARTTLRLGGAWILPNRSA